MLDILFSLLVGGVAIVIGNWLSVVVFLLVFAGDNELRSRYFSRVAMAVVVGLLHGLLVVWGFHYYALSILYFAWVIFMSEPKLPQQSALVLYHDVLDGDDKRFRSATRNLIFIRITGYILAKIIVVEVLFG